MVKDKFLKPTSHNLIVRDPRTKTPLSNDGEYKPWSGEDGIYWRRRLKDGSVIEVTKKVETPKVITTPRKKYKYKE